MAEVFGLLIPDLDEGEMAVDAVLMVKSMDADGNMWWREFLTDNMSDREALGTLMGYVDTIRARIRAATAGDPVEDDD